jgi:hypothetical protein
MIYELHNSNQIAYYRKKVSGHTYTCGVDDQNYLEKQKIVDQKKLYNPLETFQVERMYYYNKQQYNYHQFYLNHHEKYTQHY